MSNSRVERLDEDQAELVQAPQREDNRIKATRAEKIKANRSFQGFLELLNNSNILATTVEFMKSPAQAFASLWFVKYINAPLAIVANFFLAINAIRKAAIKKDGFSIANAVVVASTSAAMIVAGIAVAASIAVLSAVTPILIAASFGVKALWDLGTALVYGIKAACTNKDNYELKNLYKARALSALVDGVVGGLVTAAVVAVYMVAAPIVQTILTGFAIAAASIGILAAISKMAYARRHAKIEDNGLDAAAEKSSTCCMGRKMRHSRDNSLSAQPDLEGTPVINQRSPSSNSSRATQNEAVTNQTFSSAGRGMSMRSSN